ncbi:MAG: hypothetical protein ABL929_02795 [Ferruginibacter sp.]|nr:hypothetical protein [Ferruginibacter sp.]NOU38857.1 hypothetical protein [Ferruginibacter sp.]
MQTILKITGIVLFFVVLTFGCKKTRLDQAYNTNEPFDAAAAKEWYYGVFKNSAEWKSSAEAGKKLPDWKHGVYRKIGSLEIVEFPLIKSKREYSILDKNNSSRQDAIRLANASFTIIIFIKNNNSKIFIREIDYIPEENYAKKYNFDINKVSYFLPNCDFSGRMIIRQWAGITVSIFNLEKGIITRKGRIVKNKQNTFNTVTGDYCYSNQYCVWQQDCTLTFYGDGTITNECGEWYNTGDCWMEEYCPPDDDPCIGLTPTECLCLILGIGCSDDPPPPDDEGENLSVERDFIIHHEQSGGSLNWDLKAYVTLAGTKFFDASKNVFTSINTNTDPIIFCNIGQCLHLIPTSPAYCVFNSTTYNNTLQNNDKQANSYQGVVLFYPNTGQYRPLSNNKSWNANQELN